MKKILSNFKYSDLLFFSSANPIKKFAVSLLFFGTVTVAVVAKPDVRYQRKPGFVIRSQAVVRPNDVLRKFPSTGQGIAVEVWDKYMVTKPSIDLIKKAGFGVIRYPGGSYSDIYHWKSGTPTDGTGANVQPNTDFHSFMKLVNATGTTPLITVNYGSNQAGTAGANPAEAAGWVRDANITHHWHVQYWEIGNEIYGNGFYNAVHWEEDLHSKAKGKARSGDPALGPTSYGENVAKFAKAMKAVDPSVKIGAVLCSPGEWPDGLHPDWNRHVLEACGNDIDFVVIHRYGSGITPTENFACIRQEPAMVATLKSMIRRYCGSHASRVGVWITEGDTGGFNCVPSGADFAADAVLTWIEAGANSMDWWDLRNGMGVNRDPAGPMGPFNDQGILSLAESKGGVSEPPLNTPFPPYFGLSLIHQLVHKGDVLVNANSSNQLIRIFASRSPSGQVRVMLINESPKMSANVELNLVGLRSASKIESVNYVAGATALSKNQITFSGSEVQAHLKPFEISVLKL